MSGTELAHTGPGGGAVVPRQDNSISIPMDQRMAMMREALTNPNVDTAKAREMFLLMRDMENDARQAEFNRAKIAAIRAMPAIYKRGLNDHLKSRYAKFEDLHRAAMPVLAAHGLTLDFRVGSEGRDVTVQPILRHENGYVEEGGIMRAPPAEGNKGVNNVQTVAITTSYLKRHSMKAMLNIIEDGEDTDGAIRPDTQLNDRQQSLLVDAQEAADAGTYAAWFARQNTKDKSVLIGSGTHARLGGAPALPGALPVDQGQQEGSQPARRTPVQMVEAYEANVEKCRDRDALLALQTEEKTAKWIVGLKDRAPELHARVIEANAKRFQELDGNPPAGDGTLFSKED
jgi:hypothetical protein